MSPGSYEGVRALVLGASGFIGAWVARALNDAGADVHMAVRDSQHAREVLGRLGVRGELMSVDLRIADDVRRLVGDIQPAITFNLAGYGVDPSERDYELSYAINDAMLEPLCSAIAGIPRPPRECLSLVHVGSVLEYGQVSRLVEDEPPRPTTLYGRSKLAGTQRLAQACMRYELPAVTARLFAVYGPGEHAGRLLPSLIEVAQTGGRLDLTAGTQQRDFTYVGDVAEGLLRLGRAGPRWGEVVNVATGRLTSVRTFAETTASVLSIPADRLCFGALPTRAEEIENAVVSVERLQTLTGWSPGTSTEAGVRKTVELLIQPKSHRTEPALGDSPPASLEACGLCPWPATSH